MTAMFQKAALKKVCMALGVLFLGIQCYQPKRNLSDGAVLEMDIGNVFDMPYEVKNVLQKSCYDCHSNQTQYPWYAYIQPFHFFIERHIESGKEALNFSTFGIYSARKQRRVLNQIQSQIEKNEMPLPSYIALHQQAVLTEQDKKILFKWINESY